MKLLILLFFSGITTVIPNAYSSNLATEANVTKAKMEEYSLVKGGVNVNDNYANEMINGADVIINSLYDRSSCIKDEIIRKKVLEDGALPKDEGRSELLDFKNNLKGILYQLAGGRPGDNDRGRKPVDVTPICQKGQISLDNKFDMTRLKGFLQISADHGNQPFDKGWCTKCASDHVCIKRNLISYIKKSLRRCFHSSMDDDLKTYLSNSPIVEPDSLRIEKYNKLKEEVANKLKKEAAIRESTCKLQTTLQPIASSNLDKLNQVVDYIIPPKKEVIPTIATLAAAQDLSEKIKGGASVEFNFKNDVLTATENMINLFYHGGGCPKLDGNPSSFGTKTFKTVEVALNAYRKDLLNGVIYQLAGNDQPKTEAKSNEECQKNILAKLEGTFSFRTWNSYVQKTTQMNLDPVGKQNINWCKNCIGSATCIAQNIQNYINKTLLRCFGNSMAEDLKVELNKSQACTIKDDNCDECKYNPAVPCKK